MVVGGGGGWRWGGPGALAAAVPLGAAWVAHERRLTARGGAPLVELALFGARGFRLGLGLALVFYTGLTCVFLLLGLYLQDGMGMSPFASGLAFTPLAVLFVAASLVAPRLFARVGERLIAAGAAVMALSAAGVAIAVAASRPSGTTAVLIAGLAVMCVGPGIVVPGVINAVLRSVPTDSAGSASGVLSTAQQIGNALGVAIAGAVFFGVLGDAHGARAYDRAFAIALAWTVATAAISALLALRLAADRGAATAAASVPDRVRPDDVLPELGRRAA